MDSETDSLQFVPIEEWGELEKAFKADWPRGITGYSALVTQRRLTDLGLDYGFRVYRPRGEVGSGMVVLNKKGQLNEIIIQCPSDDTSHLEDSLINTKVIDWQSRIMVPFMPGNIRQCISNVAEHLQLCVHAEDTVPNDVFIYDNTQPMFEISGMAEDITFKPITKQEEVNVIDSTWRNRYDGSIWYFNMLSKANFGYGIFKNEELVSWIFINEVGALTHL